MRVRAPVDLINQGFIQVGCLDYWIATSDSATQSHASPEFGHGGIGGVGKKERQGRMFKGVKKVNRFPGPSRHCTSVHLPKDNCDARRQLFLSIPE